MEKGSEQRKYKRLPSSLHARVQKLKATQADMDEVHQLVIKNISLGGVFIETEVPYEVNTVLRVSFKLPESNQEISALGIVRWISNNRDMRGMGIQFLQVTTEHKEEIQKHVEYLESRKEEQKDRHKTGDKNGSGNKPPGQSGRLDAWH